VPKGATLVATVESAPLDRIAAAMLKYSTNLTAEVIGLRAHQALGGQPGDIAASAKAMTEWLRGRYGLGKARFVNHSGLSDATRISSDEMTQVFDIAASGPLPGLLKDIPLKDAEGKQVDIGGCKVAAKTGTLNFTRGLGGYLIGGNGRRLAFTILCADLEARARVSSGVERPKGARRWVGTARRQEMALLRRWATLYGK
jgi:D-alanyl-D-alanine carboxypeptidase/D-alanyl-D-alanine-endopeptidase (penicillin-binding protein 4)